jgi:outer membrane receptor protein involved in Fe transport
MQGLVRNGIPNPALQWETGEKFNAGVDVSAWNDRLTFTADLFHSKTRNMLVYENITGGAGFNTILTNNGAMQNTGVEATLGVRLINKKNLQWDVTGNITTVRNMVNHVPGGRFFTEYAGATLLTQGDRPAGLFYGYVSKGVYSTSDEAAAAGLKVKNADGS